ncbi:putative ABC transporter [Lasiosphaeris hirsuta]|uniref:ABC transporter n=1 Tax=Lasiosphaeris hirsuta TaxID=260670 RepID=A0AA40DNY8_9PEZI|nr:putative ABC transporter [Lasiosphaeris hirsuta]
MEQSPEECSGILSKAFFFWINPILARGYRNILIQHDLPHLSRDMRPEAIREGILKAWSQRETPETARSLPLALLRCLKRPFLAAILPRLFLIMFRYSQPILIRQSIRYVTAPTTSDRNQGYWLIASAVAIYVGLALSTATYEHRINRLKILTRSALVGLIHDKTMSLPSAAYDNGDAVTLMSTDADSLDGVAGMAHDLWAYFVEVVVGIVLLAGEVGWIWPLPLVLIAFCSRVSRYVAKNLQSRQKAWNEATQRRVAAISAMIGSMKVVKMLGFQRHLADRAQALREEELKVASRVRWMMVYYNASANALGIFTPAITLVLYVVIAATKGRELDTETAFTTIAILSMVTHPANMVMTIVPRMVAASAGLARIQEYLLRPSLTDARAVLSRPIRRSPASSQDLAAKPTLAISIQNLTLGQRQTPILEEVDIEVPSGSLTIISGSVGCGKSTLLRAVLGEVTPTQGSIMLSTKKVAYCAQRPWLPSGSIRGAIFGTGYQGNAQWYHEAVNACCLQHDFDSLPDGDDTQIGSGGLNLSGGQRQRVALARALFAKCEIVLLDDSFSALDGDTENKVFENLFGPAGLLRRSKTTVLLVTNSTQFFPAADHIVILGNQGVQEQGPWETIKAKTGAIAKFIPRNRPEGNSSLAPASTSTKLSAQLRAKDEAEADLSRKTGDFALYAYYFRFVGLRNFVLVVLFPAIYSFFIIIPQYWLQLWTESDGNNTAFYISGFLFLSFMSWLSTNGTLWSTVILLAPQSGLKLHAHLLKIVTGASLSFFSDNDNGGILNRFSQDIQLMDKQLPTSLTVVSNQTFKLLMQIILLLISQRLLSLSLPVCVLVVYFLQRAYLRTSRQLRFLELESGAEVFSSFLESVEGLETIRSFGWRGAIAQENVVRLENSQRPEFLLMSLQRWLNIVLDLMAAGIATSVIAIAVALRGHVSGGQVGVALNIMLVANTTLLRLVESWTNLEVSLGAISRLKMLESSTPSEGETGEDFRPLEYWPSRGTVNFDNITASYRAKSVAIRALNLRVEAGQRVVLCGRTGSGKSSMLLTLLRLLDLQSGTIELDGIDISTVPRDFLRQQCFITVSQDPLLLPNETLRFNLDPDDSLPEDILINGLRTTGLWGHFARGYTNGNSGEGGEVSCEQPDFDMKVSSFRELSVGQCQLFAICRAVVKAEMLRSKGLWPVVLLDEVTSALDAAVESTVHSVIDQEFTGKGHTVIMVSHRLGGLHHARSGRDIVVLMRDSQLQEIVSNLGTTSWRVHGEEG